MPDPAGSARCDPRDHLLDVDLDVGGWNATGHTKVMAAPESPDWKVSRSTATERVPGFNQLDGATVPPLTLMPSVAAGVAVAGGREGGGGDRVLATDTAELLTHASGERPLSARQRRYLNRSRESKTQKTRAKRPTKKRGRGKRLDTKESPLVMLRHAYMKPRAMNPSDISKSSPAPASNTVLTEAKATSVVAISVSGQRLGTDMSHLEHENYCRLSLPRPARGEPISAHWNFTPESPASPLHNHSSDRALNALVASFQTQMRKQGKLFQRRMAQMHHEHERDLANVVLAYDARTETLEQRCKQYQTLEVQTKRLLKKCFQQKKYSI